jgi:hypothetical protein
MAEAALIWALGVLAGLVLAAILVGLSIKRRLDALTTIVHPQNTEEEPRNG